jgi:hypothetical protein
MPHCGVEPAGGMFGYLFGEHDNVQADADLKR